jgi:hypothetical protein
MTSPLPTTSLPLDTSVSVSNRCLAPPDRTIVRDDADGWECECGQTNVKNATTCVYCGASNETPKGGRCCACLCCRRSEEVFFARQRSLGDSMDSFYVARKVPSVKWTSKLAHSFAPDNEFRVDVQLWNACCEKKDRLPSEVDHLTHVTPPVFVSPVTCFSSPPPFPLTLSSSVPTLVH